MRSAIIGLLWFTIVSGVIPFIGKEMGFWASVYKGFWVLVGGFGPFVVLYPLLDSAETQERPELYWSVLALMFVLSGVGVAIASTMT